MPFIIHLSLQVPVWSLALIRLDFPLVALISITRRRKILTITQDTTRAKLEQLRLARLARCDHKDHDLDMQGFKRSKGLLSLLATNH
jgi:hypothetical protein